MYMLKVVIADDEKRICQLLQMIVDWNALGFEIVAVVHNGLEALDAATRLQSDVVITDIRMPECGGLELLQRLREEKRDIDVVIISGYRQFDYAHTALQNGAEDYLLKPIKKTELTAVLQRIQERHRSSEKAQEQLVQIRNIRRSLAASVDKLQTQAISDVLNGKLIRGSIEQLNRDYQCNFEGEDLYFAAVKIDEKEPLQEKTSEVMSRKFREIISQELQRSGCSQCSMIVGNYIYCLICPKREDGQAGDSFLQATMYHIIREMQDYAGKVAPIHISVGFSQVKNCELAMAAAQSRTAVLDQFFRGTERVLCYEPGSIRVEPTIVVDHRTATRIHNAMVKGGESLFQELNTILDQLRYGEKRVCYGENLYEILKKMVEQMCACAESAYPEPEPREVLAAYSRRLCMCYSWNSCARYFRKMCQDVNDTVIQIRRDREKRPVQEAKRILDQRFREDISLTELSAMLNLSHTYLSTLFKEETGITVSQYLTKIRMKEARRLLLTSQDQVSQIAVQVGYQDEKYFMRVFKKENGLTVSEFRRLYG